MTELSSASAASTGLVLMSSSLGVIACNAEAVQIVRYSDRSGNTRRPERLLSEEIRSTLLSPERSGQPRFVKQLRSGRRCYRCRAFSLDHHGKGHEEPVIALLLERNLSAMNLVSGVSEEFRLTPRERQAAEFLLQGLASKEIADRMKISPNTVKAFLRLIMIKMGASSRTGIIGKMVSAGQAREGGGIPSPG